MPGCTQPSVNFLYAAHFAYPGLAAGEFLDERVETGEQFIVRDAGPVGDFVDRDLIPAVSSDDGDRVADLGAFHLAQVDNDHIHRDSTQDPGPAAPD